MKEGKILFTFLLFPSNFPLIEKKVLMKEGKDQRKLLAEGGEGKFLISNFYQVVEKGDNC